MDFYLRLYLVLLGLALLLGAWVLLRQKGDRLHRAAGRTWVSLMLLFCMCALGIRNLTGDLFYLHLLILWIFSCLVVAIISIKLRLAQQRRQELNWLLAALGSRPSPARLLILHRAGMGGAYAGLCLTALSAGLFPEPYLAVL